MQRILCCTIAIFVALGLCALAPSCWAGYDEGLGAYKQGDYTAALQEWQPLAVEGDTVAQYRLGYMYANGKGVMQDYNQALYWYRKAAAQKHAMAQFHLGHMYAQGYGVPQDYNQALQWYRKAAEQDAEIQNLLGWMYERGQHVPQNDAEAVRWYRRAAEQGDAAAQLNLAWMYGNGRGVPKSHAQAMQWYRRATERGLFNVQEDSEEGAPGNISGISSMPLTENVPPSPSARNVSPERIPLKSQGGVYTVPVEINGRLTLDFVLDTGASEVNIPMDVIRTLLRTGTVNIPEDFLPGKTYTLADGTNIPSARVTIRSLKIGQHLITNVPAKSSHTTLVHWLVRVIV